MLVRWRGIYRFNTQPPEGGCIDSAPATFPNKVSTHSRLKAAGAEAGKEAPPDGFNTQPPKGGCSVCFVIWVVLVVSTHSRLKAAAHV